MYELVTERQAQREELQRREQAVRSRLAEPAAASAALCAFSRALDVEPPSYLLAPAKLRLVVQALDALAAELPFACALLVHRKGLGAFTLGAVPDELAPWLARTVALLRAAPRPSRQEVETLVADGGQRVPHAWVGRDTFLLLVPKDGAPHPAQDALVAAAVAQLREIVEAPAA